MDPNLTQIAYHEAGHSVVAAWLGAEVVSVTLEPDRDDGPRRDGDAAIRWHHRGLTARELCQKELMAVLAGPVVEAIHLGEGPPLRLDDRGEWAADRQLAQVLAERLVPTPGHVDRLLDFTTERIERLVADPAFWQAIAEVADLLEAHETVSGEEVQHCLGRWLGE